MPGQVSDDNQPEPVLFESHEEHQVEEILCARSKPKNKGGGREVLVKWAGYYKTTWEPLENISDTIALDRFEVKYGDIRTYDGPRDKYEKKKKRGTGT